MKSFLPGILLLPLLSGAVHASALGVLDLIALQPYGAEAKIIELRGERGEPQPREWTAIVKDPAARGGVREVTIAQGAIVAERTPLRGGGFTAEAPAIRRGSVTVDSPRVFQIAQREAVQNEVGFHWIDYALVANASGDPIWEVRLLDNMGAPVGTLRVSASSGLVVEGFVRDPGGVHAEVSRPARVGGLVGEVADTAESVAKSARDKTLRFIGNVQERLVGERTIGPKDDDE